MAEKSSKSSKLDALRQKLKETDMGGSRGFWAPKEGQNVIRILPEVGEMDYFFQEVGRHYLPDKKSVYCPDFVSGGDLDCPVCDLVKELYDAGDSASREVAGRIRVRKMYWMNVMVLDDDIPSGPFIYTPGITVFSSIASLINDPDYGDITDLYEGTNITVERSGTGLSTEYQVVPKRKVTPVLEDESKIDDLMGKVKDLSWVEVSDDPEEDQDLSAGHAVYVLPYERIVMDFNLDMDADELVEMAEEDEEEDEHPVKKDAAKRRQRRARR